MRRDQASKRTAQDSNRLLRAQPARGRDHTVECRAIDPLLNEVWSVVVVLHVVVDRDHVRVREGREDSSFFSDRARKASSLASEEASCLIATLRSTPTCVASHTTPVAPEPIRPSTA